MRCTVGVFFTLLSFGSAAAQSPQYRQPAPGREECPQGRQIRQQQGFYPSTMTDCQVLDADTAVENQKLQRKRSPAATQTPPKAPVAAALPTPVAPAPAATAPQPIAAPVPTPSRPIEKPAAVPEPVHADYDDRMIGNWLISAKQDRFGDGGTFVAATGDGAIALAVRCLQRNLSIGLIEVGGDPKPIAKGAFYKMKFRVDNQPIVEAAGVAISDRLIQVVTEPSLVKSIRDGRETALRLEDSAGVFSTHVYDTKGASRAFVDLSRECPLD
jgi:hypothetical protein